MALPDYTVRYSPRAKNLRLKVTREDGLCVVVPKGFDERKIPPLLKQKREWIASAMSRVGETRRFLEPRPVTHLPERLRLAALGEVWVITYREDDSRTGISLRAEAGRLVLTGSPLERDAVVRKLKEWLRLRVRGSLFPLAKDLAREHCLQLGGLLVKNQRTRWASCSARKNLSMNLKLLFLRPDLVRYVLVHELCHTVHMNHSRKFWELVAAYEPRYKFLDKALRDGWKSVPQWLF